MLATNLQEEAESLYNGGHYEAAERVFTQALLYAPSERALFCGRSQCLAAQGRLDAALLDARRVVDMAPAWHVGHGLEGGVLAEQGCVEDALDAFEVALRFAEGDADAAEEVEEYKAAAAALREAMADGGGHGGGAKGRR
jgi:tetratricopeptide (TPR) repeat protein